MLGCIPVEAHKGGYRVMALIQACNCPDKRVLCQLGGESPALSLPELRVYNSYLYDRGDDVPALDFRRDHIDPDDSGIQSENQWRTSSLPWTPTNPMGAVSRATRCPLGSYNIEASH